MRGLILGDGVDRLVDVDLSCRRYCVGAFALRALVALHPDVDHLPRPKVILDSDADDLPLQVDLAKLPDLSH